MYLLSISRNVKENVEEIIICVFIFLMIYGICFSVNWADNQIHESNGDWAQQAYYDVLTISDAVKQYHQKYGEYPKTVEELGMGKKIGQSYDEPIMPSHYEIDPWGNEYKISYTDSQVLIYSTAGISDLELDATNPPKNAYDTAAVFQLSTLSD